MMLEAHVESANKWQADGLVFASIRNPPRLFTAQLVGIAN